MKPRREFRPVCVFQWEDEDGFNQQVCQTRQEVWDFIRMNDGIQVTLRYWE